jgi:hypothetical protein
VARGALSQELPPLAAELALPFDTSATNRCRCRFSFLSLYHVLWDGVHCHRSHRLWLLSMHYCTDITFMPASKALC